MELPKWTPRRDFPEIHHHGNLLQFARDLCAPHGWDVSGRSQDGQNARGSVTLRRGTVRVSVTYHLPEDPDLVRRKLVAAMEGQHAA